MPLRCRVNGTSAFCLKMPARQRRAVSCQCRAKPELGRTSCAVAVGHRPRIGIYTARPGENGSRQRQAARPKPLPLAWSSRRTYDRTAKHPAGPSPARPVVPPTMFTDRGVTVPFTTPLLASTRARRSDRQVLELIVPNPSGARGVYSPAAADITALGRSTVHIGYWRSASRRFPSSSLQPSGTRRGRSP